MLPAKLLFVNGGNTRNVAVFEGSSVHGSSTCSRNLYKKRAEETCRDARDQNCAVCLVYGVCLKVSGSKICLRPTPLPW